MSLGQLHQGYKVFPFRPHLRDRPVELFGTGFIQTRQFHFPYVLLYKRIPYVIELFLFAGEYEKP